MNNLISTFEKNNIFNQRLALARSLLALGTLLLILLNDMNLLTDKNLLTSQVEKSSHEFFQYNIFSVLGLNYAKLFAIFTLILVMSGYFPKVSSIFHAWVNLSICNSFLTIEGGDQVASNLSLLMIPICVLDNRKNQWYNSISSDSTNRKSIDLLHVENQ